MQSSDLINMLEADGWFESSRKGSHITFRHPIKKNHVTVPHPKKDLGTGLVHRILKDAGLK